MDFTVLTLFPELVNAFFRHGMVARAIDRGLISGRATDIRQFSTDRHNSVDDRPYGGGSGMVMMPGPLKAAVQDAKKHNSGAMVAMMSPQGEKFTQAKAAELAGTGTGIIFICGRYEGIDERVYTELVDEEMSIGDYVMTGGELAAMVIIDSTARLIPGVLGSAQSAAADSFTGDRLEYAQYTRPEIFDGNTVPGVLTSGNHEKIRLWRKESSLKRTFLKRPDLLHRTGLDDEEKNMVRQWCRELENLAAS
jgi:tRNA (guanine37-N1)-methyltransferase